MLLFADDTVVIAPTPKNLKKIEALEKYFDNLDLRVNLDKTKVVRFRRGGNESPKTQFTYKGEDVQIAREYVY